MALVSILLVPSIRIRERFGWTDLLALDLPLFVFASGSVLAFYVLSQREARAGWRRSILDLPFLMSVGIGLCVNNTRAVLEAIARKRTGFIRTPKLRLEGGSRPPGPPRYRGARSPLAWLELGLGVYFTAALAYALARGIFASVPFLLLFQTGYLYTALLSLRSPRARV
jgi:hypothetical protein